jgi:D-alanyl-D-alanine carboxypeptidase
MRRIIIVPAIFGIVIASLLASFIAVKASGDFLAESISFLGNKGAPRFSGQVAGEATDRSGEPMIPEQRLSTSDYLPIRKTDSSIFAAPTAHASVLLDASSEKPLYENNADEHRAIASITKLFTAMITVESVKDLDEPVTISENAVYTEGTRVGCPRSGYCTSERLHVGERISVRSLLHAALMNSANDSANALAEHVGGTQENFVERMNARAKELGLDNSHFCTPSGLEIDGKESECYSSARDVAKIAAYALRYPVLWSIMQSSKMVISSVDGQYHHDIFNTDQLLGQYPNLVGTKTGFTPLAGKSLLAVASDDSGKHKLIAVVLDDGHRWQSVPSMLRWGFQSFDWR